MNKVYVLLYMDVSVSDFKIFSNFNDALTEYLRSSINETKKLLAEEVEQSCEEDQESTDVVSEDDTEDETYTPDEDCSTDDDLTCVLQVFEINDGTSEYRPVKDYDIDYFHDFVNGKENVSEYLDTLEQAIEDNQLPAEIVSSFTS